MNRKNFIKTLGLSAGIAAIPEAKALHIIEDRKVEQKFIRIAHLTDTHIQPEGIAQEGVSKAIDYVQRMDRKPDFIFTGGDHIMDALGKSKERTLEQWKVWDNVMRVNKIPVKSCIGNHDVWGWSLPKVSQKEGNSYSKKWASEILQMKNRYYSFTHGLWKFIILDSTYPLSIPGYMAKLDDEQMEWLKGELSNKGNSTYTCITSHIPIMCISSFFDGGTEKKKGGFQIGRGNIHSDAREIKNLLFKNQHVKVCLSGHIHLIDSHEYLGVKYFCNGAVSGNWWGGRYQEFDPALAIVDLYDDGSVENKIVYY